MTQRIIGICGYKGSGKSEVAKRLIETHGFVRVPFAYTLKAMLIAFGLTEEQVNGSLKEVPCNLLDGKTPRWAMQSLGTEWGRVCIAQDVWIRAWKHRIDPRHSHIVVDDLRFFNEARALLDVGAVLWRVEREGFAPEGEPHPSEAFVNQIPVHGLITNNKTIEALHVDIDNCLEHLDQFIELADHIVREQMAEIGEAHEPRTS